MKVPSSPVLLVSITWNVIMKPKHRQHFFSRSGLVRAVILAAFLVVVTCLFSQFLIGVWVNMEAGNRQRQRFIPRMPLGREVWSMNKKGKDWNFNGLVNGIAYAPDCMRNSLLIIIITSAPENRHRRDTIRKTWCSDVNTGSIINPATNYQENYWRCAFMIGSSPSGSQSRKVQEEVFQHKDILLGDYLDSYRNLSLKVITGFHWVSSMCSPKFVLKTDDDCFVNINLLLPFLALQPESRSRRIYSGKMFHSDEGKTRVIRNPENKWHISKGHYAPEFYPTYASGTGYILSGDAIQEILGASHLYKPFPNEDAYIGVLADEANLRPLDSYRFSFFSDRWTLCNFMYFLVLHEVLPSQQAGLMAKAIKGLQECQEAIRTQWD